jgi:hypothetical protein
MPNLPGTCALNSAPDPDPDPARRQRRDADQQDNRRYLVEALSNGVCTAL